MMHHWGDWDDKLFADVGNAAEQIGAFCRRWGRIQVVQTKEKYGTVRVYCQFGCGNLHELIYPGYVRVRGPYKLMVFPLFVWMSPVTLWWQRLVYRAAYRRALKRYPHIREEILCCADFDEYLEGL